MVWRAAKNNMYILNVISEQRNMCLTEGVVYIFSRLIVDGWTEEAVKVFLLDAVLISIG